MKGINKKGFEFSFGWIFAIIVGAVIIFLGIYMAMNIVSNQRNVEDSIAGNQLGIILTPVETGLESAKSNLITFSVDTRVYNTCTLVGNFGEQKIAVATHSGIGKQWEESGVESKFYNKYILSASTIEGRSASVLVKPLVMPYKVADLIFLWSNNDSYCFVNAPNDVKDELADLQVAGMNFTDDLATCKKSAKKVCFSSVSSTGCDVLVDINSESVKKDKQTMYYISTSENALLYAAIFADPGIYECQIKRLMLRSAQLALIYRAKSEFLSSRGCNSNLENDLNIYANQSVALNNSIQLRSIGVYSEEIRRSNNALSCKLF